MVSAFSGAISSYIMCLCLEKEFHSGIRFGVIVINSERFSLQIYVVFLMNLFSVLIFIFTNRIDALNVSMTHS